MGPVNISGKIDGSAHHRRDRRRRILSLSLLAAHQDFTFGWYKALHHN
jgi:hypothetical protein